MWLKSQSRKFERSEQSELSLNRNGCIVLIRQHFHSNFWMRGATSTPFLCWVHTCSVLLLLQWDAAISESCRVWVISMCTKGIFTTSLYVSSKWPSPTHMSLVRYNYRAAACMPWLCYDPQRNSEWKSLLKREYECRKHIKESRFFHFHSDFFTKFW